VPKVSELDLEGLDLAPSVVDQLLRVDKDDWAAEVPEIRSFFDRFGERLPRELSQSLDRLAHELGVTTSA
jgi:phosphoenolpyruvate carboxykinase (GTP)